jgi:hypothetical protein
MTIAWWETACGLLGIAWFGAIYFHVMPNSDQVLSQMGPINYWAGMGFFAFTFAAGQTLLKQDAWGMKASCICQAVQVIGFSLLRGPVVRIEAGPFAGVMVTTFGAKASLAFHSAFFLGTRISGPAFQITVNFLALFWAGLLFRAIVSARQVVVPSAA